MKLACWFGRHDYSVVGEWRRPKPEPGAIGLPSTTLECNKYVYGRQVKAQCDHCGKRRMARFRRAIRENLWLSTGVDVVSDPQWHTVVDPFGIKPQLVKGPTHEEIAQEEGW